MRNDVSPLRLCTIEPHLVLTSRAPPHTHTPSIRLLPGYHRSRLCKPRAAYASLGSEMRCQRSLTVATAYKKHAYEQQSFWCVIRIEWCQEKPLLINACLRRSRLASRICYRHHGKSSVVCCKLTGGAADPHGGPTGLHQQRGLFWGDGMCMHRRPGFSVFSQVEVH